MLVPELMPIPFHGWGDYIDRIGQAKYITKCDLLKGYWAENLTKHGTEISAFFTLEGAYQYQIMPFGMQNSQATFVRLMNKCLVGIPGVKTFINDVAIYDNTWKENLETIYKVFHRLHKAQLTINFAKSNFCQTEAKYLGHIAGYGKVTPMKIKTADIAEFPIPKNVKSLKR